MSAMDQYAANHANEPGFGGDESLVAEFHTEEGSHDGQEVHEGSAAGQGSDQDAARRKRKMITMGICGVMAVAILGAVGTKVLKSKGSEPSMQLQTAGAPESVVAPLVPNSPTAAPVVGEGPADGPGADLQVGTSAAAAPGGSAVGATVPVGPTAPQTAPNAPMAPVAPMAPLAPGATANVQTSPTMPGAPIAVTQAPAAPVQAALEVGKAPAAGVPGSPVAPDAGVQAAKLAKATQPSYFDAEAQDKLRLQVAALQKTLKSKEDENTNLRLTLQTTKNELTNAQNAIAQAKASQATQPPKAAKPVVTERKTDVAATEAKRPSAAQIKKADDTKDSPKQASADKAGDKAGSKVRSDFSIYAVTDGRAWVTSKDGERHGPLVVGSPLADGSKVTSMDPTRGVLGTTAGEIQ